MSTMCCLAFPCMRLTDRRLHLLPSYEIVESQALFLEWHTDGDKNQQTWTALEEANPTFFNINDAMGFAATTDAAAAQLDLQRRLEEKYPARSEFELV